MRNKIFISQPYIKNCKSEIFESAVRLCAKVTMVNPNTKKKEIKECYFEFDQKYKKYLCDERSDAFVMGLLTTAMENNLDIEFESPLSEKLYYQLTTYYIPLVSKNNASYPLHNIKLIGPTNNTIIKNENAVATGCSGGVDSFYTIAKHTSDEIPKDFKLTHIVYGSIGTQEIVKEKLKKAFKENISYIENIALHCNTSAIACFNNLYEFYKMPFKGYITFYATTYGSIACAIQKLLSIYYISSGDPISEFNLDISKSKGYDASIFDVFTVHCMDTENLKFYNSGMEYTRIEKEKYISNYQPARNLLTVCGYSDFIEKDGNRRNCSICNKCLRTMCHFYVLNTLENFSNVFNVEQFMKHKSKYLGKMMAINKKAYVKDMKIIAKKNNINIPFMAYIFDYCYYLPLEKLKKILKKSLFVRKIYYKYDLDYKMNGFRSPVYEIYKDKINKKD